uniref:Uncharacterized protein n=1 Tax=Amphimedon queenslandica TaxID=400682 RepID=A0A1X7UK57_AMPQE
MYTMSAIDPALIILVNIYADQFSDRQETSVYNNGVMQVSVFVSVNYNGEASEDDIIAYVQDNVDIYSLNYGENVQWQRSTTDNGFHHDIEHAANKNAPMPPKMISDIRAPLYFTVPFGTAEGEHRWIVKLDGKQTSDSTPLTVNVNLFSVSEDDFEISEIASLSGIVLRALKYKKGVFPDTQKLVKSIEYKGLKFTGTSANSWVSMAMSSKGHKLGVFIEYRETSSINIATEYHFYDRNKVVKKNLDSYECIYRIVPICDSLDNTANIDSTDIEDAWNEGIAMVMIHDSSTSIACEAFESSNMFLDHNFETNDFEFEDNFGGRVEVKLNWDAGDWWGTWKVTDAKVVHP